MENNKKQGSGLIDPQKISEKKGKKEPKRISIHTDGLMERQNEKVLTEDGRELLKESN